MGEGLSGEAKDGNPTLKTVFKACYKSGLTLIFEPAQSLTRQFS
jgi:hypothetical protein